VYACHNWRELAAVIEAKSSIMDCDNISTVLNLVRRSSFLAFHKRFKKCTLICGDPNIVKFWDCVYVIRL
jgi:hypothetical protein